MANSIANGEAGASVRAKLNTLFASAGLAKRPRVAFAGDSKVAFAINAVGANKYWTNNGFVSWVRWQTGQRICTDQSLVTGLAGSGSAHFRDTQVPQIIAAGAQIAVYLAPINDVGGLADYATSIANMDTAFAALNAAGIPIIVLGIAPTNSNNTTGAGFNNATKQQQILATNRWLWAQSQRGDRDLIYVSPWPYLVDYSTGYAQAAYLYDGLHDNPTSAPLMARPVSDVLNLLLPSLPPRPQSPSDTFDLTLNPGGTMLTNGLLTGSATVSAGANGATGFAPTSWTGRKNAASTMAVAFSKGADATYSTLNTAIMTLGGTGDGANAELTQTPDLTGLVAGDLIYMEAECTWSGLTNISAIYPRLLMTDGSTTYDVRDGSSTSGKGDIPASGSAVFRTEPLLLPPNFQSPSARLTAASKTGGGAVAGTVTWSRVAVRKAGTYGIAGI